MSRDNLEDLLIPDAFGRLRVSEPTTVFDCKLQYDLQPLLFETQTAGAGSVVHDADAGCAVMSVGTASGDRATRQSRRYCTYQPGKSQLIDMTGSLGSPKVGVVSRMGYGDSKNGVFLEQSEDGPTILFRSSVTGSLVETRVKQADWNLGCNTGIDLSKSQIFVVDLQWLGVGLVKVGFNVGGQPLAAHQFKNDGINVATYWTTATLPVRYEIENVATSASSSEVCQICCSVQSEGGFDLDRGFSFGAFNSDEISVGTSGQTTVLSIRPKLQFNGIENHIGTIPTAIDISASSNSVFYEVVYNPTIAGAAWSDADASSGVEFDETGVATGGTVIFRGLATGAGASTEVLSSSAFPNLTWLTNSIDGDETTPLSIRCRAFPSGADVAVAVRWQEVR